MLNFLLGAGGALAQDLTWVNVGPGGGGWIQALACDPRDPATLYLGCDVGGFYLSRDAGRSWKIQNTGLDDYFVECIAVHPSDSHILVLGTQGGLFKSTDQGRSWRPKRQGFPPPQRYSYSAPIGAVCFDPHRPKTLYAGIGRPRWRQGGRGQIYKSDDGGETWRLVTPEGTLDSQAIVSDLEVSPDGAFVLAATDKGLYRSEDGGATWQICRVGLPFSNVQELAIAPSNPGVVYCTVLTTARDDQAWNGGVYRSEDGGRTWAWRSQGLATQVGKSGEPDPMTSSYKEIVVDPRNEDVVYVGDESWVSAGVYKTTDGGQSWARVTDHATEKKNMDYGWITFWGPSVTCLALCPSRPERVIFGTSGHVFLTNDAGATWQQRYCRQFPEGTFGGTGLEVTCLYDIVPDPADPHRVYFCYADIGLLISDDRGQTFRTSQRGMRDAGNCFTMAFDPADPNRLWAATGQWSWNEGFLCRSLDRGRSWTVVGQPETGLPSGQVWSIAVDPTSPAGNRTLYVTCRGYGVFKSEDDGISWHSISNGLPPTALREPCGLLMDPQNSRHLRLALGGNPLQGSGLYETWDGGAFWAKKSEEAPFADLKDLAADPYHFDTLYLCQREKYDRSLDPPRLFPGGVFKSTDGGVTWTQIFDDHFPNCIAVSPQDSLILYLGTTDHPYHDGCRGRGVFKSQDGGQTWQQEVQGLSSWNISCLTVDPHEPSRLYAGTGGNGVFIGTDRAVL